MEAAGSHFMNDEEVTAWIEELRADDDRIEKVYQEIEEQAPGRKTSPDADLLRQCYCHLPD